LPAHAPGTHLVTVASVTALAPVHRSRRDSAAAQTMRPRQEQAQGNKTMFDDAASMFRVLAGCVLGGCFAVVVILQAAVG